MDLLRRKAKLSQPWVGVFLKKDDSLEGDTVNDVSDIYPVGIFAHVSELHDLNDRMRLLLMGHRRIRITERYEEFEEVSEGEGEALQEAQSDSNEERTRPLLMVVTENVESKPFETDQEIQVW
jgi:Lon-like ATP-dependent protease